MEKLDKLLEIMESRAKKAIPKNTVVRTPMIVVEVLSEQKVKAKILGYEAQYTLFNKTGHLLYSGDSVMVESTIDNLNNGIVVFKFGDVPSTSGSNSDGNYIKYDDGTMICYRLPFTLNATGIAQNFPQPFTSLPAFTISAHNSTTSALRVSSATALSATSVTFYPYNSFTTRIDSTTCSWMAIGRWK
jgi:hypothetical protein